MARKRRLRYPEGIHQAYIETLSHDGRGIAKINGKTTFIDNALPAETVQFRYTSAQRKFDEGIAITIDNPSSHRVEPKCKFFDICGGCALQHLDIEQQHALKQNTLLEQFSHFGQIDVNDTFKPLIADVWGYRRKARLGVRYVHKKNQVLVGFREKRSNFIADINYCEVLHPDAAKLIEPLKQLINKLDAYQSIPQIEVAVDDDKVALVFRHLEPLSLEDLQQLQNFSHDKNIWLYLQPKGLDSIKLFYPQQSKSLLHYDFPQYNLTQYFNPSDFTQVNLQMNHLMIARALEALQLNAEDKVLDLFCGGGNFTLPMAPYCAEVTGVEGSQTSIERAKFNAQENHIKNVQFYCHDLTQDLKQFAFARENYHKILLDPARTGAENCVKHIELFCAELIVYISCNPATLARDAGILSQKGYKLKKAGIMDMFPHTNHVESIAVFEKNYG